MRDKTRLHPALQTKITRLIKECDKAGLKIGIGECLRTVEEQDALYAKGRTAPGNIVTNAKGSTYSSMHQWGVAFDFYRNDGKGAYYDRDNFFTKVGEIGKKLGLEWGGDWKTIKDKPHFQLPNWGSNASKLNAKYGTPDKFFSTWQTIATYEVIKNSYLRSSASTGTTKVKYSTLSTTLKKKCKDKDGWAVFLSGKTFTCVKTLKDKRGNMWAQMKSGYWLPVIYEDERRVEKK